jgi:cytoskeletal protein RodZ
MSTVAEKLRQAREAKNLTITQVAETTKIRSDHIRALEQGDYNVFSAPVYIRGFIRTYATLLKLDVKQLLSEVETELGKNDKFHETAPLGTQPKGILDFVMLQLSKIDWRKGLIGAGVVLVLVIVYAMVVSHRHAGPAGPGPNQPQPANGLKPGTYKAPPGSSGETLPVPQPAPRR